MDRIIFLIIIFSLLAPLGAGAAVLYLEPGSGDYYQGDTFIINVRIDAEEECVNTIQADLEFPQNYLEVKDVSRGNSIISFWVKEPEFSNETGLISFAGGIPGGFCGLLLGDPGESNLLGKIIFKVKDNGEQFSAEVKFSASSQVLLNDGLGTPAKIETRGAEFTILPKPFDSAQGKQEWREELAKDTIPPEIFKIEINQESTIFEGKYFITFYTADKQTGVDYYEVKEGGGNWQKTESPYLLEDQSLKSIIKVRAVDKAGNERISQYAPPKSFPDWIIILILAIAGVIWWLIRKLKIKNEKP